MRKHQNVNENKKRQRLLFSDDLIAFFTGEKLEGAAVRLRNDVY
jgi:hypothetical protein